MSSKVVHARTVTLLASLLVSLSSGTNYVYSAYAPQLGSKLHITHTQLNIIGFSGNIGVYLSGPLWGRLVDKRGPSMLLLSAFVLLLIGYSGIRLFYDTAPPLTIPVLFALSLLSFLTGSGGSGGLTAAMNTTAKSYPDHSRATATSLVISGFGLSAFFFSTIAHLAYPGDTSGFLLLLSLGTSIPMLVGLFLVKPIPPIKDLNHLDVASHLGGYQRLSTSDINYETVDSTVAPLLDSSQARGRDIELSPSRHLRSRTDKLNPELVDIHGWLLFRHPDFWLLFFIMSFLTGTGLMWINNVGSISQALYAKENLAYNDLEAARWQATQVSTTSVTNCLGRVILGFSADFTRNHYGARRSYFLSIIAALFILSQVVALQIEKVGNLWVASALLGLAYGGLFGLTPVVIIEWFGLDHFSQNWGFVTLSPLFAGNLFSLAFGRNLDAHAPQPSITPSANNTVRTNRFLLDAGHQCLEGRECYIDSLNMTVAACFLALALCMYAGWRDWKIRGQGEIKKIFWEEGVE